MPEATEPTFELKTVKELGAKLPIGIFNEETKTFDKHFALRPYKSKIDRHLNHWREANQNKPVGLLTVKLLSLIVSEVGKRAMPLTEAGDSTPEQEFEVSNWFYADVMYMYLYLRIVEISEKMEVPYVCGRCKETGYADADLWTTEVRTIEEPKELEKWVTLRNGIKLRTGRKAKKLKLKPVTFRAQLLPESESPTAGLGYSGLRESIVAVDCERGHYTLTDEELDEIDKIDQLCIDRQANIVTAGPDMRTTIKCPKENCGALIKDAFDWTYDNFFDSSVPSSILE